MCLAAALSLSLAAEKEAYADHERGREGEDNWLVEFSQRFKLADELEKIQTGRRTGLEDFPREGVEFNDC